MTYHKCGCTTDPFGVYVTDCDRIRFMRGQWWNAMKNGSPERAEIIKTEINEHKEVY